MEHFFKTFVHACCQKCLRNTLWEDVGVVRKPSGLQEGSKVLADLAEASGRLYETSSLSPATVDLLNGTVLFPLDELNVIS